MYAGPVYDSLDQITCEHRTPDGKLVRRQVAKEVVLWSTAWAVVCFAFQDRRDKTWQPVRYTITRWRRVAEKWRKASGIALAPDTAGKIGALFRRWDRLSDAALAQDTSGAPDA